MAEPTYEELKARLADLEKKGAGRRTGELEFKVGEKGGVSVYGLGRFPVTLYYEQWIRLLDTSQTLRAFLLHTCLVEIDPIRRWAGLFRDTRQIRSRHNLPGGTRRGI
jgi:hypothetical protein